MADKKLNVTQKEFKDSFRMHYHLYNPSCGSEKTRRLILFYSVECGLKYLILKNSGKNSYEEYCASGQGSWKGHNVKDMIKEVNPRNDFVLRDIQLKHGGGSVHPSRFNELWRYGVETADPKEEEKAERTLVKVAEWLKTVV